METPKNASKLADLAIQRGWIVSITHGRGAKLSADAPEGFWPAESVAVRLRSPRDHVRAYGVWVQIGGANAKFDNGGVLWRQGCKPPDDPADPSARPAPQGVLGYRELRGLVDRDE